MVVARNTGQRKGSSKNWPSLFSSMVRPGHQFLFCTQVLATGQTARPHLCLVNLVQRRIDKATFQKLEAI